MAIATKKTRKSRANSTSQLIRDYHQQNPKAKAREMAEKFGCSQALVHQALRRGGKKKRRGRKPGAVHAQAMNHAPEMAAGPNELCVTFVRAAGGFAEAKKMLLTAEFFAGKKIR